MADRLQQGALGALLGLWLTAALATAAHAQALNAPPPPPPPPPPMDTATANEGPVVHAAAAPPKGPNDVVYGAALRARYVSVPGWFLGLFTKKNVPLSSYGFGGEFFRRKGELDIALGISYQKMGPPDGNWLGKNHDAGIDTDFIQFKNFGFVGLDASFIWRTQISEVVGFHYGAGVGLAFMTGKMLRISAGGCNDSNVGDPTKCFPRVPGCNTGPCTEAQLKTSEGHDNGPTDPHRFEETSVPGAIPILNMLLGFNFKIPDVKGLEFRLEGGFYNAFVVGLATGYVFP
jgi:hypothetical protein